MDTLRKKYKYIKRGNNIKMKLLHVLAQLPERTGSGVYYSNMVEGFKKYNHEQKAVFAVQDKYQWYILEDKDRYPVTFKSKELPFPIAGMSDVMPYDNTTYSSMTKEMLELWKSAFIKRLIQVKEEFQPDIIFAHHLWILTSIVREVFPHTKIIGICHNTDLRQASMNPLIKDKYVNNIDKLDYIFSASEEQKQEIEEVYGLAQDKMIAVGGGFNQNIFYFPKEKEKSDKVRLVFCAKIDPSKGIYELVEVYKSLKLDDVTLDIIGSPDKENEEKLDAYIGGDKSIRVYNVENQADLGDELRRKDIFLMPSFYEGLGLMAIESLACGLYVVTTEIEALMSLLGKEIEESGIIKYVPLPGIYDTDKPLEKDLGKFKKDLKEAILLQIGKVRTNKNDPERMEEEIKTFSWEGLVDKMNKLIYSLADFDE